MANPTMESRYFKQVLEGVKCPTLADVESVDKVDVDNSAVDIAIELISAALRRPINGDDTTDEKLQKIMEFLPNPKDKRTTLPGEERTQRDICARVLTKVIELMGGEISQVKTLNPEEIITSITSKYKSIRGGSCEEFKRVLVQVSQTLTTLKDLKVMLEGNFNRLLSDATNSNDSSLKYKVDGFRQFHSMLISELDRQINYMAKLHNTTIKQTSGTIMELLSKNKDFEGIIHSIKKSLGSDKWGDKLSFYFQTIGNDAMVINLVAKALKGVGITKAQYGSFKSMQELDDKLFGLLKDIDDPKELNTYIQAMNVLKKYYGRKDVAIGGGCGCIGGAKKATKKASKRKAKGGYIPLKKKLKARKNIRKIMLEDFRVKSKIYTGKIFLSIKAVSMDLNNGKIAITDNLHRFKMALNDLDIIITDYVEYYLTGYYTHPFTQEKKKRFMSILRAMIMSLDELIPEYSGFSAVKKSIESFIVLIDTYTSKLKINLVKERGDAPLKIYETLTMGGNPNLLKAMYSKVKSQASSVLKDVSERAKDKLSTHMEDVKSSVQDKIQETIEGGTIMGNVTFRSARNVFNHYYNIAKFKSNLKYIEKEIPLYNKNYKVVVGTAVADEIKTLKDKFDTNIKNWSEDRKDVERIILSSKMGLYKAAQAIDQYLMIFTDKVISDPNRIEELGKILKSVDFIANWFNDKSGDSIASLFEIFPSVADMASGDENTDNKFTEEVTDIKVIKTKLQNNYIDKLKRAVAGVPPKLPGDVSKKITPKLAKILLNFAKYALDKVFVLKNIISAFSYLGDVDESHNVFMSPQEIYDSLMVYFSVSILTKPDIRVGGAEGDDDSNKKEKEYKEEKDNKEEGVKPNNQARVKSELKVSFNEAAKPNSPHQVKSDSKQQAQDFLEAYKKNIEDAKLNSPPQVKSDPNVSSLQYKKHSSASADSSDAASASAASLYSADSAWASSDAASDAASAAASAASSAASSAAASAAASAAVSAAASDAHASAWAKLAAEAAEAAYAESESESESSSAAHASAWAKWVAAAAEAAYAESESSSAAASDAWTKWVAAAAEAAYADSESESSSAAHVDAWDKWVAAAAEAAYAESESSSAAAYAAAKDAHSSAWTASDSASAAASAASAASAALTAAKSNGSSSEGKSNSVSSDSSTPPSRRGSPGNPPSRRGSPGNPPSPPYDRFMMSNIKNNKIFEKEDSLFVDCIKSMASKVMTVSGLHHMMHHSNSRQHTLTPTRMIIGGDPSLYTYPTMHPDAAELYIRIPLLIEFYRDIFAYDNKVTGEPDPYIISMLPEVGSMWGPFIQTIFDQPIHSKGVYSDAILMKLIEQINEIYVVHKKKDPRNFIMNIINDFVSEINSRFTVVKRDELTTYQEEVKQKKTGDLYGNSTESAIDFDILKSDNKGYGMAPSDYYSKPSSSDMDLDYTLDPAMIKSLRYFRGQIEKKIQSVTSKPNFYKDSSTPDFTSLVVTTKDKLESKLSAEEQFKAVKGVMKNMTMQSHINREYYIMFHETVITPLNALFRIKQVLQKFTEEVKKCDGYSAYKSMVERLENPLPIRNNYTIKVDRTLRPILKPYNDPLNLPRQPRQPGRPRQADVNLQNLVNVCLPNVDTVTNIDGDDYKCSRLIALSTLNLDKIFKDLMKLLFGISASMNKLCEVEFRGSFVNINYGKLQTLCETLLLSIRGNITKFRGVIPDSIINNYDGMSSNVSVGTLQSDIVDKLFRTEMSEANETIAKTVQLMCNINPDKVSQPCVYGGFSTVFDANNAVRRANIAGLPVKLLPEDATDEDFKVRMKESIGITRGVMETIYYSSLDAVDYNMETLNTSNDAVYHCLQEFDSSTKLRRLKNSLFNERFDYYIQSDNFRGDDAKDKKSMGLFIKFNEIMASFLKETWDSGSKKYYLPLVDKIANGSCNQEVFQNMGFPDIKLEGPVGFDVAFEILERMKTTDHSFSDIREFCIKAFKELDNGNEQKVKDAFKNQVVKIRDYEAESNLDKKTQDRKTIIKDIGEALTQQGALRVVLGRTPRPGSKLAGDPDQLLFATLSKIIRVAINEVSMNNVKLNVVDSISEVSARMKDKLKAVLPIYGHLFKIILNNCDIVKNMMSMGLMVSRRRLEAALSRGFPAIPQTCGPLRKTEIFTQEQAQQYYGGLIEQISTASKTMISTCDEVLSELNDMPLFLEVSDNSISQFKSINDHPPYMPLSTASAFLQDDGPFCYPIESVGSNMFSFNYGTRSLLHRFDIKHGMSYMPGMVDLTDNYNTLASQSRRIPSSEAESTFVHTIELMRYLVGAKCYSRVTRGFEVDFNAEKSDKPTYQMDKTLADSIGLTTNRDSIYQQDIVVDHITAGNIGVSRSVDRNDSIIYNILDLNIVPINVHALRREIPLVNIYNYSYTFDSFVTEMLGTSANTVVAAQPTARDIVATILKNPFSNTLPFKFPSSGILPARGDPEDVMQSILQGKSDLSGCQIPQFIKDQLFDKSLGFLKTPTAANFGNTYSAVQAYMNNNNNAARASLSLRADTIMFRKLMFVTSVQKIMITKMDIELKKMFTPVVSGYSITNPQITDYNDIDQTAEDIRVD